MKPLFSLLLLLGSLGLFAQTSPPLSKDKAQTLKRLDELSGNYTQVAMKIWNWAELGYQETKSSQLLQDELRAAGFKVEAGVADMPTAFVASFGSGKPVIGILGEFDALPGVSQAAVPTRQERPEVKSGHACGHHLFGSGSAAAVVAVKEWLQKSGKSGTIRFYGTPAEEGGGGKVYMVRAG
ncbi:MAG TPA: M20/M25/M40 family metallo-hydrolase, partial [Haliscomenobacter sp.]|nr:M20/M25/M40 family metallo-hydrolase [Haliscomenobacter sp.]